MKIEKLELNGFKSFADRTTFKIHPGITCIVGPNGCGKSNIVDAIRWVLGEQSAKTLRGEKMEEVIFNGSQSKKPKGMAEVTLYIKMPDESGNGDTGERIITVGRRLYRSGESEYLINRKPCRLKDIREMFLDTGLEMKSYSILEQGRIGEIINARPQDRRFLIEEVAGIMKYKARKAEAQNKLENSRMNLQRISDILKEVKRQRNSLDRQAKKAERYKRLKDELREIEIRLARYDYVELKEKLTNITAEIESLRNEEAGLRRSISEKEASLETTRVELIDREKEIETLQNELSTTETNISELEKKNAVDSREIIHIEGLLQSLKKELQESEEATIERKQKVQELQELVDKLTTEIQESQKELQTKTDSLRQEEERLRESEKGIDEKRKELFSISDQIGQLRNELHRLELRIENTEKRISSSERELEETHRRISELENEIQESQESIKSIEDTLSKKRQNRSEYSERLSGIKRQIEDLKSKRLTLREEIVSAESRINSLKEMLSGSTEVTALKKTNINPLATVSELIEVSQEHERAVEAALEEKVKGIVLNSKEELLNAVEVIARKNMPRVSLVYAGGDTHRKETALSLDGIKPLSELVQVLPPADRTIKALLSNYLLVTDVNEAFRLLEENHERLTSYRLVTLKGEVVEAPGVVTCGSGSDILKKRREIRELERTIESKRAEVEKIDLSISELSKVAEETKASLKDIEAEIIKLEGELSHIKTAANRVQDELNRYKKKADFISLELEQLKKEIQESNARLKEKRDEIKAREQKRFELESDIQILQDDVVSQKSELEIKREELTELKIRYNAQRERLNNTKRQLDSLKREIQNSASKRRSLDEEIQKKEARVKELKEELIDIENRLKQEVSRAASLKEKIRARKDVLDEFRHKQHELQQGLHEVRQKLDDLSKRLHEKDLLQTELSIRIRNLVESIKEKYQTDITDSQIPLSQDIENDRQMAQELKQKMEAMGEVNLAALDEFKKLNERYEFLQSQHDDIVQSIEELEEAIARINRTTRKRLKEAFESLNQKFAEVFKILFGGGHAELRLTDESNILESGIDIIAQPPGKKLQNINLLSGGEKALTALALLFAGFLLKPTPLCILDEADAPLDENNVIRFREMVRELSKNIQFVIITHNRLTMEAADYLYGITMEEAGVSKVLSMEFVEA